MYIIFYLYSVAFFFEYTSRSKLWHIQYVGILKEFDKYCQMAIWGRIKTNFWFKH